jgi:anti-sigma B factor antagonist
MNTPCPSVNLGPELTIAFAAAARDTLFDALLAQPGDLTLDLGGVTDFDSAGVQLLLAAQRSLAERGDALRLLSVRTPVRDAMAVFGLTRWLQGCEGVAA